jgi:hypothetical protein
MPIEELLDECVRIRAAGGDITPLLTQHPELRQEVEGLLALVQATERLPAVTLSPEARRRMFNHLHTAIDAQPDSAGPGRTEAGTGDETPLHQLAHRLGVPREAIRRYLGLHGAAQVSQFLGVPGYGGMFAALGWLLRCLQVLEHHGLWL